MGQTDRVGHNTALVPGVLMEHRSCYIEVGTDKKMRVCPLRKTPGRLPGVRQTHRNTSATVFVMSCLAALQTSQYNLSLT